MLRNVFVFAGNGKSNPQTLNASVNIAQHIKFPFSWLQALDDKSIPAGAASGPRRSAFWGRAAWGGGLASLA